jgi:hypothetical protein
VRYGPAVTDAIRLSPAPDLLPPPVAGQVYVDASNDYWTVKRVTIAEAPPGFYLVHLDCGPSRGAVTRNMVLGPRAFAALMRDRRLQPHFEIV